MNMKSAIAGTAVIYARVSSTGDRQSTERQVKDLTEYARYKGYDLVRIFEEHVSGAKRNEERPVLTDAVEYCQDNRVGTLLVSEMSRLGRNAFEVLSTVKTLSDSGVNLYLQKEQMTLFDDEGKVSLFSLLLLRPFRRVRSLNVRTFSSDCSLAGSSTRRREANLDGHQDPSSQLRKRGKSIRM